MVKSQPLKQIRYEDDDEDLISKLPDSLLIEILSRLPSTKDAVITGALSKRWQHVWTYVPTLIFLHPYESHHHPNPDFFSFVNKTLTQSRISKLIKFKLHTRYDHRFEYHIHNWIRYAVKCNVQHLHLTLSGCAFPLDDFVFSGSCFTDLTLSGCAFNPTGPISWEKLRSLRIWHGKLDEDLIENILRGSPVLETLVLNNCYGYRRLNIMSRSVKKLVLAGYMHQNHPDVIEINAPNILSLAIQDNLVLRKLLLLNVSSLVEVVLDYWTRLGRYETTPEEAEEEMLEGLILNLVHVKELKIGISCFKVLARLKAKGFNPPSNLRVPDVTSHLYTYDGHTGNKDSFSVKICPLGLIQPFWAYSVTMRSVWLLGLIYDVGLIHLLIHFDEFIYGYNRLIEWWILL